MEDKLARLHQGIIELIAALRSEKAEKEQLRQSLQKLTQLKEELDARQNNQLKLIETLRMENERLVSKQAQVIGKVEKIEELLNVMSEIQA